MDVRHTVFAAVVASAVAVANAQALPLPRGNLEVAPPAAQVERVQFPVWGGFGDAPRGRPFIAGRPNGSSWWSPPNDNYAGRYSYGPRYYYGTREYGTRYYSRRHLRRGRYR